MRNKKQFLLLFFFFSPLVAMQDTSAEWTWLYRKQFSENSCALNADKKSLLFSHIAVPHFTQLIFSWNAMRPEKGYFSFHVQVRDAATKQWGQWHCIADWGNAVQRSYLSKSDGFSSQVYVRLETDNKKDADAFRIRVESVDNASLSLVRGLFVALSNFNSFKPESEERIDHTVKSVCISGMPAIAQLALDHEDKNRICSPVSCSMVVEYITKQIVSPLDFAAGAFDMGLSVYGSWPCNVAHAFVSVDGKAHFFVRRLNSFIDLHKQLLRGMPVIVSVRGTLPGALKPFPHGHLMVVIGWDATAREVLCHDPAAESNDMVFKRYPLEHFLRAWECSHRLVYSAEPINLFSKK